MNSRFQIIPQIKVMSIETDFPFMPANLLPLDPDYSIPEPDYRRHLSWLANVPGVTAIVCNGHAAEVSSLTREERGEALAIALDDRWSPVFHFDQQRSNLAQHLMCQAVKISLRKQSKDDHLRVVSQRRGWQITTFHQIQ